MAEKAAQAGGQRRFNTSVAVAPTGGGFAVRLDGRGARTPAGRPLVLPTQALAEVMAEEWVRQGERIDFSTMPATRLAHTALDAVPAARGTTAAAVARQAGSDLLCYFAEAPASLVRLQEEIWGPILEWAAVTHDLAFVRAQGVMPVAQPPETLARMEGLAGARDDFFLAALAFGAALFGSAVLTLALAEGRLTADAAFAASRLDEAFEEDQWGVDAEAAKVTEGRRVEAQMLGAWFAALC